MRQLQESTEEVEKAGGFQMPYPHPEANNFSRLYNSLSTASVVSVPLWLTPVFSVIEPVNERR